MEWEKGTGGCGIVQGLDRNGIKERKPGEEILEERHPESWKLSTGFLQRGWRPHFDP
jgi:hypothetical protein